MYGGGYMAGGMGMSPQMGGYGAGYGSGGMGGYGMGGYAGGRGAGGAAGGEYGSESGRGSRGGPSRVEGDFVEGKLFIGGLDTNTSKEALAEYCQQWGELADYVLMEGRGFGFVTFRDPAGAQAFLEHREHVIEGKEVEAKAAMPRNSGSGSGLTKKMFVGGTGEIRDEDFRAYFEQYGDIEDFVVLRKPDGGSRGFGFVTFKDEVSVEKCLVVQHRLNGRNVELKRAIRKEDMAPGQPGSTVASYGGGYGGYGHGGGGHSGGGGGSGGGGAGGPMRTGKALDWMCPAPECRNKNFGWREQCNRCQLPKPANPELAVRSGPGSGGGRGGGGYAHAGSYGQGGYGVGGYGQGASGMDAMAAMGMGMGMGMPGMGYGMGMPGMYGMGMGMPGMAGMGMGGMGMGGYGGMAGGMGGAGAMGGYGRSSGAGAGRNGGGAQGRYKPY